MAKETVDFGAIGEMFSQGSGPVEDVATEKDEGAEEAPSSELVEPQAKGETETGAAAPKAVDANAEGGKAKAEPKAVKPAAAKPSEPADGGVKKPEPPSQDLARLVAQQQETITQLLAAQNKPKEPAKKDEPKAPAFNVDIPQEMLAAMASEDPGERAHATKLLINGSMNMVWNKMEQALTAVVAQVREALPQMIQSHTTTTKTQEQVFNDFYGKFPQLNNPALQPVVVNVAARLAQADKAAGRQWSWNDEFRDRLGQEVLQLISGVAPQGQQQTPPQAPAKQPFVAPRGNRSGTLNGGANPFLDAIGL